jgi:hypothetical protein
MTGRKTIAGVCMLCALLVSGFAAQSASAISGTTVFTCKEGAGDVGGKTFSSNHCRSSDSEGKYGHYAVAENTSTELSGHSVGSVKAKTTVGGVPVTVTATGVEGTGTVENKVDVNGEHYVQAETFGVYTGVTVNVAKCFVYTDEAGAKGAKGVVDTEKVTTTSKGQGDAVKVTAAEGEVISRFWILDANKKLSSEGGECGCDGTFTITGSLKGEVNGATFNFNHAAVTAENTFKLGTGGTPNKAGFEGTIALEGRDPVIEKDTFKPLSVTTVTT